MGADLVPGAAPDAAGRQRERFGLSAAGAATAEQQAEPRRGVRFPDMQRKDFRPARPVVIVRHQAACAPPVRIQTGARGQRAAQGAREQGQIAFFAVPRGFGGAEGAGRLRRQGRTDESRGAVIQPLEQGRRLARPQHRAAQGREARFQTVPVVSGQGRAVQTGGLEEHAEVSHAREQARGRRGFRRGGRGVRRRKGKKVAPPQAPGRVAAGDAVDQDALPRDAAPAPPQAFVHKPGEGVVQPRPAIFPGDAQAAAGQRLRPAVGGVHAGLRRAQISSIREATASGSWRQGSASRIMSRSSRRTPMASISRRTSGPRPPS